MSNPDVLINFVLDRSGSMIGVKQSTIDGFNSFIADQREEEGEARLSLTFFSSQMESRYVATPLSEVAPLGSSENPYTPGGATALLDAVGATIKGTEAWLNKNPEFDGRVVCVILTDGQENSSRAWHIKQPAVAGDEKDLGGLISWKQNEGWEFMFLGAGGSDWLEKSFGSIVDKSRIFSYEHSGIGHTTTYNAMSTSLRSARSTGSEFLMPAKVDSATS